MTKRAAVKRGESMARWAKANLSGDTLRAWAEEQGLRSDAAAARGAEVDAAMYAAAFVMAKR